jgi:hypothetical protein
MNHEKDKNPFWITVPAKLAGWCWVFPFDNPWTRAMSSQRLGRHPDSYVDRCLISSPASSWEVFLSAQSFKKRKLEMLDELVIEPGEEDPDWPTGG